MRKWLLFALLIVAALTGLMSFAGTQAPAPYYYAFKERIPLVVVPNKLIVRYAEESTRKQIAASIARAAATAQLRWEDDHTVVVTLSSDLGKVPLLQQLAADATVLTRNPVYTLQTSTDKPGAELGTTDEVLIRFLPTTSAQQQAAIIKQYNLRQVKATKIYQLFKVPKGADALAIANGIQEAGVAEFSYPNFLTKLVLHQVPNDSYFSQQFSLHNTGQTLPDGHAGTNDADIDAPEAWAVTRGSSSIVVAVLDEGVTSNHPDLPNSRQVRLAGSNFGDGDPNDPSPTGNGNHGNSCAGLIAATQNNNEGVSGVAPNCKIMPIRIFNTGGSGITSDRLADALVFAADNGADVISNSWGYDGYSNPNLLPVIVTAIQHAVTTGRGGRGCVVAFSTGNNARHTQNDNGVISFPSSVNIAGVLTVGASDRNDRQADYSPSQNPSSGDNQLIDVTAPSHRAYPPSTYQRLGTVGGIAGETFEVWSIDIPGFAGYNPWGGVDNPPASGEILPNSGTNNLAYTGRFGGTSAACPQVSATAALVLSLDPTLTQQQVFDIITGTADKVGGYTYTNCRSNELGFGRLNTNRAVRNVLDRSAYVAGPSPLCDYQTYSLQGLYTPATVTWSSSDPSLATIDYYSGQAHPTYQNSTGTVTFYATVTPTGSSGGCNTTVYTIRVNVGGCPTPLGPICGHFNYYYGENDFYVDDVPGAVGYRWMLLDHPPATVTGTHFSAPISPYEWPNSFTISVTAIFASGEESDTQYASFDVDGNGVGSYLCGGARLAAAVVYPNPTSDYFQIGNSSASDAKTKGSLVLYDKHGTQVLTRTEVDETTKVSARDLPAGLYHVQIRRNGKTYSAQLAIQH